MRKFEVICEKDNDIVSGRIEELIKRIDDEPKSTSWKMRAKVGTSKKWYKDVDTPGS